MDYIVVPTDFELLQAFLKECRAHKVQPDAYLRVAMRDFVLRQEVVFDALIEDVKVARKKFDQNLRETVRVYQVDPDGQHGEFSDAATLALDDQRVLLRALDSVEKEDV